MSSQGFSFPPPPPPPPPPLATDQPPTDPQARHGQNRGGRGLDQRGRGRGQGNRGRGGNHARGGRMPSYHPPAGFNFAQPNYSGYPSQALPTAPYTTPSPYHYGQTTAFQSSQPSSSFQPQFPQPVAQGNYFNNHNSQNAPSFQSQQFPQPVATGSYPRNIPSTFPPPEYMQGLPVPPHGHQPNNRALMGSVPWHNGMQGTGSYMGVQPGQTQGSRPLHGNNGASSSHAQTHAQKRDHSSAFTKPQSTAPRTPAAPAVPSFGNPLPSKPPPAADTTSGSKAKRRRRKHNQLGLTPHANDNGSSEDEAAEDEESNLAQSVSETAPLKVSYKGRTSKLETASDIAAWIAERKKKFPTRARIEEKKKAMDEAKAAREAARPPKNKGQQKKRKDHGQKQTESSTNCPADAATNADRKETIRRDLAREEQRILDAMAETNAARLRVEALRKEALRLSGGLHQDEATAQAIKSEPDDEVTESVVKFEPIDSVAGPVIKSESHGTTLETSLPENPINAEQTANTKLIPNAGSGDVMDCASDHEASDWTSSGWGSDSESDDDDSAPEQISSRRTGPERVPPPPREGKKTVCRYFARNGHCNRGDQCKFLHDNEASERTKAQGKLPEKKDKETRRKGLYQALLDRQKEDEDRRAMEVIAWLGQNNILAPTQLTPTAPHDTPMKQS